MMIEYNCSKPIVSFETAKLLKSKGFKDEYTDAYYTKDKKLRFVQTLGDLAEYSETSYCDAPYRDAVLTILRDTYHIIIRIYPQDELWTYEIRTIGQSSKVLHTGSTTLSYEDTCDEAIIYCIKNLIHIMKKRRFFVTYVDGKGNFGSEEVILHCCVPNPSQGLIAEALESDIRERYNTSSIAIINFWEI